jgi:endonuclease-8
VPEGDTVYNAARHLDKALTGQVLTKSDFRVPSLATSDISGATVTGTVARGKHLLTRFDNGLTLRTHLKMEGIWYTHPVGSRWRRPAHTARVVLRTATTEAVGFQVTLDLVRTTSEEDLVGHLGPDLLGPDWDPDVALQRLRADADAPIGDALLEQRNLAGVGNVYKSELCFLGHVDPLTPVGAVPDLPAILTKAKRLLELNKLRYTRITTGNSRRGYQLWVYGRRGPCLRCNTRIAKADQGPSGRERPTYWCPTCQPLLGRDRGHAPTPGGGRPPPANWPLA